ncbi:MAG: lysophospholipid acyltransferase family protein [Sciscionella sp.]
MAGDRGWGMHLCVSVLRPLAFALTRQDWAGLENLPADGGYVLAVNHTSQFDFLAVSHFVHDAAGPPRFLIKSELFGNPILAKILTSAGQIPVYRRSATAADALAAAEEAVRGGECVVVYVEGTLTRDPNLWPMRGKTGAARIALATGCPVIPVAQWGAQEVLLPYARRAHLLPRKTMRVRVGPRVDLSDLRSEPITPTSPREATDRIVSAITAELESIRGEQAPAERYDPRATKRSGGASSGGLR